MRETFHPEFPPTKCNVPTSFFDRLWGNRDNETEEYQRYFKFVEAVANASFWSLNIFKEFKGDKELNKVDMLDLADKVSL